MLVAMMMVAGAMGANIATLGDHQLIKMGEAITTPESITTGLYILKLNPADNASYVCLNQTDGLPIKTQTAPTEKSVTYLVKLTVQDESTNKVTIQLYNGQYIKGTTTNNAVVTVTDDASAATVFNVEQQDAATESATARFFFNIYDGEAVFHLNNNGDWETTMKMVDSGSSGGWSQFSIFPVTIEDDILTNYTLTTLGAPAGATYYINGTEIEGNNFTAYPSELTSSSVTVQNIATGFNVASKVHSEQLDGTGTYTISFTYTGTVDFSAYIGKKEAVFADATTSIEGGKWYLICQNRGGDGYAYNNNGTYYKAAASNFLTNTIITEGNKNYLFQFIPTDTEDVYYIQNADGTLFGVDGNIGASTTGHPYKVKNISDVYFYIQRASDNSVVDNNGNGYNLAFWGTAAPTGTTGNNVWRMYEVDLADIATYTVTWNIQDSNGTTTLATEKSEYVVSGQTATLTKTYAYTDLSPKTVENVTSDTTVNVTATFSTPFVASTDFDNATWYYLQNANTNHYVYYDESHTSYTPWGDFTGSNYAKYKWAFIGNPVSGYQVINKAAGNGKYLYIANAQDNGTSSPAMSGTQQSPAWILMEGTDAGNYGDNHISFKDATTNMCWNKRDYLGFWGGYDAGSNWYLTVAPVADDLTDYNAALTTANALNSLIGEGLNKYTETTSGKLASTISNYGNKSENSPQSEVDAAMAALATAIAGLTLNLPEEGTFLKLVGANCGGYMTSPAIGTTSEGGITMSENADASVIWYFDNNGLTSYYSGFYLDSNNKGLSNENIAYAVIFGENPNHVGTYTVFSNNRYSFNRAIDSSIDRGNTLDEQKGYAWTLEAVTSLPVTMHQAGDGKYYATVCVPTTVQVSGATAYYVSSLSEGYNEENGGYATLTEFENGIIPANTGALLIGTTDDEVSLTVSETAGTQVTGNKLKGSFIATKPATTESNTDYYYFGQNNGVVGFYTVSNVPADKYISNIAWIETDATGSDSKGFAFAFGGDDPTGLNGATTSDEISKNAVRYNLQGQRVDNGYKGIVIIGGKKYIVK